MIKTMLRELIGSAPSNYEPLEYLLCGLLLIFLISFAYRLIKSIFGGWFNVR